MTTHNFTISALLLIGILIRLWLLSSEPIQTWLQNRLEISTPLTSWNRVLEGIYLKNNFGLSSTYGGDLVHELPMMLRFYELFTLMPFSINYLFVIFDILNAGLLYNIVQKGIQTFYLIDKRENDAGKYKRLAECLSKPAFNDFLLNKQSFDYEFWSLIAFGAYLLNSFCIASCVANSTIVVQNFVLLLWLFCLLEKKRFMAFFFLAVHTNLSIYSGSLVLASILFLHQSSGKKAITKFVANHLMLFLVQTSAIFLFNLYLEDFNTRFIKCTYLFILEVPDLVPNLGVFWYFLTEMFDHFRLFYTYVFQFNVLLYAVPISMRLKNDPIFSLMIQIGFISTLKSYPSIGETGMFLSMLPMAAYLFPLLRNFLIYSCMIVAAVVLAPIMFYLWLGSGGGNANFYFAITLVYSTGMIFLVVDAFYAFIKREFIKLNGSIIPKDKNGIEARFELK